MRTLNISISDSEFEKLGLKKDKLSFTELVDLISRERASQNLQESIKLGEKYGLSKVTMDEINEEIKVARQNAKANI